MVAHMILEAYTRVAVIDTGTYDLDKAQEYVDMVAEFYGLPIERIAGSLRLLDKLIHGPHDEEFIVVEPGEVLEERIFWDLSSSEPAPETPPNSRGGLRDDPRAGGLPRLKDRRRRFAGRRAGPAPTEEEESMSAPRQGGEVRGREHRRHPQHPLRVGPGDGVEAAAPLLLHRLVRHQPVPRAQGRRRAHGRPHRGPRVGHAARGAVPRGDGQRPLQGGRRGVRRARRAPSCTCPTRGTRGAVASEAGTALLAIGGEPGCVYTPSAWDQEPLPGQTT